MLFTLMASILFIALVFLFSLDAIRGRWERRDPVLEREEAMLVQEIHASLQKMEKRVEALETILIEKYDQGKNNG